MSEKIDVLPSSRPKTIITPKGLVNRGIEGMWEPVYCASCGKPQGLVPENAGFAFVQCDPCFAKFGVPAGMMAVPDEVFWKAVHEAQLEEFGRLLTADEEVEQLANPDSTMSLLARSKKSIIHSLGG